MDANAFLRYYSRADIQKEIARLSKNREVVARFGDKFGKRPDTINYPADVLELARQGATSFHFSEELWKNPLLLRPDMKQRDIEELRTGFDLVFDIDCSFFEYSRISAELIVELLKHHHSISSVSAKFSGNKGFHIAIPFEALPETIGEDETRMLFPEAARRIAFYIKEKIKKPLGSRIMQLEGNDFNKIMQKTGRKAEEIRGVDLETGEIYLNAEPFLAIDTILISPRHLFRAPYSLHEKSGLASIPVDTEKIPEFRKEEAAPEKVKIQHSFLEKGAAAPGEARDLVMQAFDFQQETRREHAKAEKEFIIPETALPEKYFPPCIKCILKGLEDGRKRAVFVLINFLRCSGWEYEDIEKRLEEWNKKNKELLRDAYWKSQLRYHRQQKKMVLPPNCGNKAYYQDMRCCFPDARCRKIKNPVNYARISWRGGGFKKN